MTHTTQTNDAKPQLFDEGFLRKLEQLSIHSRRALAGQLQGERRSPKRGQSVEFADFRQYSPGDDFRRIDWNAYARLDRFFIKLFVEEEDLTVHILLDASQSMDFGEPNKLRYALKLAGALSYITLAGLDRVTITALGAETNGSIPARRGKHSVYDVFNFLTSIKPVPRLHLAPALTHYAQRAKNAGPLLLISDLLDPQWEDGLKALSSARFDTTVLHLLSPQEIDPRLDGDLTLLDAEVDTEVEITADDEIHYRYVENLKNWQKNIRRYSNARSMQYAAISSDIPVEVLLFAQLRQQMVLK